MSPSEYRAALESLYRRRRFGLKPGLEVIERLLEALGHPERRYPAVHITGSKGKGSVAVMTQSILTAHGLRVGLFTSPHLVSYRERVRIDGEPVDRDAVADGLARVDAATRRLVATGAIDREPTFFEATTALALDTFARRSVDAAVVEVGIGGRLDATNVLSSRVGVITTVELEHTDLLGSTVVEIAREKAGIFHRGMVGLLGTLPTDAEQVVRSITDGLAVPTERLGHELAVTDRLLTPNGQTISVRLAGETLEAIRLPLLGSFQPGNAALALGAARHFLESLGRRFQPKAARHGIAGVVWPGRLERRPGRPERFLDVAHTPESARAVAQSLGEIAPFADPADCAIVFGALRGKSVGPILDALSPLAHTLVLVPVASERTLSPEELRPFAVGRFPRIVRAPSVKAGVALAESAARPGGYLLVVGSDYLVGEWLREQGEEPTDEPDLSDPGTETRRPTGPVIGAPGRSAPGSGNRS